VQGLAAISASNGWAMAAAGACIVIGGLAVLSFIISQLHRMIAIFEKRDKTEEAPQTATDLGSHVSSAPIDQLSDVAATARVYRSLTAELGESFELIQLYRLLETAKIPHPIITVRELRGAGYLVPTGDGAFSWKNV